MLFCLGFSSLRIMMLAAFYCCCCLGFFQKMVMAMCVCADTSTKLIISNKRSVRFLALKAWQTLKSHTAIFFCCFGHCFLFPALIILILHVISGWQMSRLLKGGCLCLLIVIVMKPAKNHYKMLESSHTPRLCDSYFNYRSQISCFSYTKQHIDKLLFKCESHNFKRMSEERMACTLHGAQQYVLRSADLNKRDHSYIFKDTLPSLFFLVC